MGRPERHDADYFPFYAKDGRTLFVLESKFGCSGTGFFTNVMRILTLTPDHHICIKEESDRLYFFSKCHCDDVSGAEMLLMMVKTGKIDKELWEKASVVASQDLLNSLEEAYRKRSNKIISIHQIKQIYGINPVNGAENPDKGDGYPEKPPLTPSKSLKAKQSKGKERKASGGVSGAGNNTHEKTALPFSENQKPEEPFSFPTQEEIDECSETKIVEFINSVAGFIIAEGIYTDALSYIIIQRNNRVNQRALLHALCKTALRRPENPKAFMDKILSVENGNYHGKEHLKHS